MGQLLLALALVPALGASPAQGAKPKKPTPCPTSNALQQNDQVILQMRRRAKAEFAAVWDMIACHRKTRRRTDIDTHYEQTSIADPGRAHYWLAGRFVAAHGWFCPPTGGGPCNGEVVVTDVRTGRYRRTPDTGGPVENLVLTERGRLAYIRRASDNANDSRLQVVRFNRDKTVTVLDNQPGIDYTRPSIAPNSLATDGRRLYWLTNGQPRFAPFG